MATASVRSLAPSFSIMCFDMPLGRFLGEEKGATLSDQIKQRMRKLYKGGTFENVSLDINEVIKEVLGLLRSEAAKRRVLLEMDLEPELPAASGDRVQIQQVMMNLCINGLDAMNSLSDRTGKLSVRTRVHGDALIRVEVQDNGVGLRDPDRIFEAFFTTKENGMAGAFHLSSNHRTT